MFLFLQVQYKLGKLTATDLKAFVPKRISAEQYKEITGIDYVP